MTGSIDTAWRAHHAYLVNLAYQMLGDVGDAEDIAQEAFLRLARAGETVDDLRAWLTVVAGRLCLDLLRSARVQRVRPDGDVAAATLPDPVPGPADRVTLDDEVSAALLAVLRTLSPAERVAFVLHDVFGTPFEEIAATVGRPVGTCRQLARRARTKIAGAGPGLAAVTRADHRRATEAFITACANGDLAALTAVLDPQVWGVGTVLHQDRQQVNHGPHDVAVNLLRYLGPGATVVSPTESVLLAFDRGRVFAVLMLTLRGERVLKIEATADPAARQR
ncbi:RNA polymerase sigma factor SigI [Mycolicibacterium canariasense]|uniref:RNA polymerase sigma factor SigI n=1 Tax=Mycolicibacterium canariasense TaxID=228230 RepID=A0A124E1Z9_MYCCR|nr:RNA polymerase sigma factor SigI [Mycolicibacterium canariasense]MCV7209220.1 RNA polymerase sigma factor SigI [Mycolicibacterium canariasense]ORV05938.1 RNA polymerase subunit sigma [Mycolicibacterium canariasense]GAS95253.1 RNA polymerase sigma factor SigI [Mycolicibacterium canariasense]